ncbi:MAG: aminotransferase class IV [Micrococcales bacterium]
MLEGEFFRFEDGSLVLCRDAISELHLAVADSWLVEDGKVRSLEAHFERFERWVSAASPRLAPQLDAFFELVSAAIPTSGRYFPRIELHQATSDGLLPSDTLFLRLRTAPEQLGAVRLWTLDEPDPRSNPAVKGPDLSLCMQLRRKAQLHGADETVLVDSDGYVIEGALSSIVWWRGDVLCSSNSDTSWLPSITRAEVFELAKSAGFETRVERVRPDDLRGCEIWALSSLQGIRPVVEWQQIGDDIGPATHLETFQRRLRMLARVIE